MNALYKAACRDSTECQAKLQERMGITVAEQQLVLIIPLAALHAEDLIHGVILCIAEVEVWVVHIRPLHREQSCQALDSTPSMLTPCGSPSAGRSAGLTDQSVVEIKLSCAQTVHRKPAACLVPFRDVVNPDDLPLHLLGVLHFLIIAAVHCWLCAVELLLRDGMEAPTACWTP